MLLWTTSFTVCSFAFKNQRQCLGTHFHTKSTCTSYQLQKCELNTCPFHGKRGQMPSLNPTIDEHIINVTQTKNNIVLSHMVKMFQHVFITSVNKVTPTTIFVLVSVVNISYRIDLLWNKVKRTFLKPRRKYFYGLFAFKHLKYNVFCLCK